MTYRIFWAWVKTVEKLPRFDIYYLIQIKYWLMAKLKCYAMNESEISIVISFFWLTFHNNNIVCVRLCRNAFILKVLENGENK